MMFIGFDPGAKGGVAVYDPSNAYLAQRTRTFNVISAKARGRGTEILWAPLCDWLDMVAPTWMDSVAFVEQVGAMPGNGGSSMFKFGVAAGGIRGILAQRRTPINFVTPGVWKKHFKLPAAKDAARARACELFPWSADQFKRVKDDGVAEAALIAKYGYDTGVAQ